MIKSFLTRFLILSSPSRLGPHTTTSSSWQLVRRASLGVKMSTIKFLSQDEAIAVDQELFNEYQYSVDQLMELAGLSVASVIAEHYSEGTNRNVLVVCGPGNNGGDGFVAARHLKLFGFNPVVVCPKLGKGDLFQRLLNQVKRSDIEVHEKLPDNFLSNDIIVDAVFGFSYKPPLRSEYRDLLNSIVSSGKKLVCVDVPSGWSVNDGPPEDDTPILQPDVLVSLTAPKLCARRAKNAVHYVGGRFVPPSLEKKYQLNLPQYPGVKSWTKITFD